MPVVEPTDAPVISSNIAKGKPANSSWSWDTEIADFGNDDDFKSAWVSNKHVKEAWYEVDLVKEQPFNAIVLTVPRAEIVGYRLQYFCSGKWTEIPQPAREGLVKIHRFDQVWASRVRVLFPDNGVQAAVAELGVYFERPRDKSRGN
jgi:alpha-L-fucosidase